jgi:inorganic pyrophosphatase
LRGGSACLVLHRIRLDTLTADNDNQRVHELHRLPTFAHDDIFHVVVESPRGSTIKLKHDPSLDVFSISRPLPLGLAYPYDWGFVPSTRGPDGDPVDAAVFWDVATFPGVVIQCRAFALIKVEQRVPDETRARRRNDRILAIPIEGRRQTDLLSPSELPTRMREELELFFITAAALEGKDPRILGWEGPDAAVALLRSSAV